MTFLDRAFTHGGLKVKPPFISLQEGKVVSRNESHDRRYPSASNLWAGCDLGSWMVGAVSRGLSLASRHAVVASQSAPSDTRASTSSARGLSDRRLGKFSVSSTCLCVARHLGLHREVPRAPRTSLASTARIAGRLDISRQPPRTRRFKMNGTRTVSRSHIGR